MSGTSADGVDAALVRVDGHGLEMGISVLSHRHHPYNPDLRNAIFAMRASGRAELATLARIGREITLVYADAVRDVLASASISASQIATIAAHGQTLFHEPPLTIQWFDPALLAAEVGCCVVSDFRRADCAAGGQGAPLVPFADYILFRHPSRNRGLLNIGGIANLTLIRPGESIDAVTAFDCGPGNCIADYLCRAFDPAGPGFDVGGERAARGRSNPAIVEQVLRESYFCETPPKSTDGPAMIRIWENTLRRVQGGVPDYAALPPGDQDDLLATASHLTAMSIVQAIAPLNSRSRDSVAQASRLCRIPKKSQAGRLCYKTSIPRIPKATILNPWKSSSAAEVCTTKP